MTFSGLCWIRYTTLILWLTCTQRIHGHRILLNTALSECSTCALSWRQQIPLNKIQITLLWVHEPVIGDRQEQLCTNNFHVPHDIRMAPVLLHTQLAIQLPKPNDAICTSWKWTVKYHTHKNLSYRWTDVHCNSQNNILHNSDTKHNCWVP